MMIGRSEGSISVLGNDFKNKATGAALTKGNISIVYQDD